MLIGGIQDKNKVNNMQLLFYKYEKKHGGPDNSPDYKVSVEAKDSIRVERDFENDLNKAQLEMNQALRSTLTFEDTKRTHFLVL